MLSFLKNLLKSGKLSSIQEEKEDPVVRSERLRALLLAELSQTQVDGRPVTHRRLESLMLATGTGKTETIRLLREIGARPSSRRGAKLWTRGNKTGDGSSSSPPSARE